MWKMPFIKPLLNTSKPQSDSDLRRINIVKYAIDHKRKHEKIKNECKCSKPIALFEPD